MIVREFRVNAACEEDFELVFESDGVWCDLLQRCSDGYINSELQVVSQADRCYRVRDLWKTHWDFELFRARHQPEVEEFRKWLAAKGLVEHEKFLGSFYRGESDRGDEAGLVSA